MTLVNFFFKGAFLATLLASLFLVDKTKNYQAPSNIGLKLAQ